MSEEKRVCEEAAKWARTALKAHKSTNKKRLDCPAHEQRLLDSRRAQDGAQKYHNARLTWFERVSDGAIATQDKTLFDRAKQLSDVRYLADLGDVLASQAGNCSAYSLLALGYIHAHLPEDDALQVKLDGGDHVFAAVFNGVMEVEKWSKDMTTWPADVWICDPWANVVSTARKYYEVFTTQMKIWAGKQQKQIFYSARWISPTDTAYLDTLQNARKVPVRWRGWIPTKEQLENFAPAGMHIGLGAFHPLPNKEFTQHETKERSKNKQ